MIGCKLYKGTFNSTILKTTDSWNNEMWMNIRKNSIIDDSCHSTIITDFMIESSEKDKEEFIIHKMTNKEKEILHKLYEDDFNVHKFISQIFEIKKLYNDPEISIWFILEVLHPLLIDKDNYEINITKSEDYQYLQNYITYDDYCLEYGDILLESCKLTSKVIKLYSKLIDLE